MAHPRGSVDEGSGRTHSRRMDGADGRAARRPGASRGTLSRRATRCELRDLVARDAPAPSHHSFAEHGRPRAAVFSFVITPPSLRRRSIEAGQPRLALRLDVRPRNLPTEHRRPIRSEAPRHRRPEMRGQRPRTDEPRDFRVVDDRRSFSGQRVDERRGIRRVERNAVIRSVGPAMGRGQKRRRRRESIDDSGLSRRRSVEQRGRRGVHIELPGRKVERVLLMITTIAAEFRSSGREPRSPRRRPCRPRSARRRRAPRIPSGRRWSSSRRSR